VRRRAIAAAAALAVLLPATSGAAELVVQSAAAMRGALADLPGKLAASGETLRFAFGTAGAIRGRIEAGEAADLVILPPAPLGDLAKAGLVLADTQRSLVLVRIGAAVRAGAPHPAIADEASFKAALAAAPSLGMADPASGATSGIYLAKLVQQLGLGEALKDRIKLYPDGANAMAALAQGEVALAAGQISEIVPVAGIELVGPIPEALQLKTIYAAAVAAKSASPEAARALLSLLAAPEMAAVYRANGFDPP
jgi:molybdate transport system substrate-binding protein